MNLYRRIFLAHGLRLAMLLFLLINSSPTVAVDCNEQREAESEEFRQLSRLMFRDAYGTRNGIGILTNGYLECYEEQYQESTGLEAHAGLDLRAPEGTKLYSPVSGTVISACNDVFNSGLNSLSIHVEGVNSEDVEPQSNRKDYTVTFLHLQRDSCYVKAGDFVHAGQLIAQTGKEGTCTRDENHDGVKESGCQPHLHIEVQPRKDIYPCGNGNSNSPTNPNNCPFGSDEPTSTTAIAENTSNPSLTIATIAFARDENRTLESANFDNERITISGINFGESMGKIFLRTRIPDEIQTYTERELPSNQIESWENNKIVANLSPNEFNENNNQITLNAMNLLNSLLIRIERTDGTPLPALPIPFKDMWNVPHWEVSEHYWTEPIMWLWHQGASVGYKHVFPDDRDQTATTGFFGLENIITFGELLKLAVSLNGGVSTTTSCNCSEDHWANPFICEAIARGWSYACNQDPDQDMTRRDAAKLMASIAGMPADYAPPLAMLFEDIALADPDYEELAFCKEQLIFEGYPSGEFQPANKLIRAEMATILKRLATTQAAAGAVN